MTEVVENGEESASEYEVPHSGREVGAVSAKDAEEHLHSSSANLRGVNGWRREWRRESEASVWMISKEEERELHESTHTHTCRQPNGDDGAKDRRTMMKICDVVGS